MDWQALAVPGAFVVGAVAGSFVVIRVARVIVEYLRDHDPPRSL